MICIQNLSLAYKPDKPVLSGIDALLPLPGVYALMGPSGLGKTTLIKAIGGLIAPQLGSVEGPQGAKYSVLFQEDRLLPWMSALMNVCLVMPKADEDRGRMLLTRLGIESVHAMPATLSGGMQRRVALARALAYGGTVLLLDEPFASLDKASREQAARTILASCDSVIFSTHDPEDARVMGATCLRLYANRLEIIPQEGRNAYLSSVDSCKIEDDKREMGGQGI